MSPQQRSLRGERLAMLLLSAIVEPGDARLPPLLEQYGAEDLLGLIRTGGPGHSLPQVWTRRAVTADDRVQQAIRRARSSATRWVCPGDSEWQHRLGDLDHVGVINRVGGAPLGLWVRGSCELGALTETSVAVVGARNATTYGSDVAGELAADLADAGATVVSGAAFGIDSYAHRGALALARPTAALLACGADIDYPRAHSALLSRIAGSGLVASEQLPGERPTKARFLSRNRLISALTTGTVVVEAAVRSGALNTLNWATELGRVAMGVPGPVTSQASVGVHQVLRQGQAILVTSGSEVLEAVGPPGNRDTTPPRAAESVLDRLPEGMRVVLEAVPVLGAEPAAMIADRVGCTGDVAETVLGALREHGWVEYAGGGWRLSRRADLSPAEPVRTVSR